MTHNATIPLDVAIKFPVKSFSKNLSGLGNSSSGVIKNKGFGKKSKFPIAKI